MSRKLVPPAFPFPALGRWLAARAAEIPRGPDLRRLPRLAASVGPWEGPGRVVITTRLLVFVGAGYRRTALDTISGVEQADDIVWIRRKRAHGWLVVCESAPEADRLAATIREAIRG